MLLRISVVYFHLLTLCVSRSGKAHENHQQLGEYQRQSLENYTGYWPKELKLMLKHFSTDESLTNPELTRSKGVDAVSSSDNAIAPFLMPIFVVPTESLYIGSIVSNKAILTSCSSTVVIMEDGSFLYVKAEQFLVVMYLTIKDKVKPFVVGVMEVRRHPTCDRPYPTGSWRNDVAILLLPIAVTFKPKVLEPIKLPSLDFFEIYSAIKKKMRSDATCYAVIMKYQGESLPKVKTLLPVKIRRSSGCPRTCGYMIDQCRPELGGYAIHLLNANDSEIRDFVHGAAILCDGLLYGVLKPDYTCGYQSFGHLPKPEAMLYMFVNFADPDNIKVKPIVGSNGSLMNGSSIAVFSITLVWVIAMSIATWR